MPKPTPAQRWALRDVPCGDDRHHRYGYLTHRQCSDQLCCWGPAGKREPCPDGRAALEEKK